MEVRLSVRSDDETGELTGLTSWLQGERELRGRVELLRKPPGPEELGGAFELLTVAVSSGGAAAALAKSLPAWLASRRRQVTLKVTASDGRTVELTVAQAANAQPLIEAVLRSQNGAPESPGGPGDGSA